MTAKRVRTRKSAAPTTAVVNNRKTRDPSAVYRKSGVTHTYGGGLSHTYGTGVTQTDFIVDSQRMRQTPHLLLISTTTSLSKHATASAWWTAIRSTTGCNIPYFIRNFIRIFCKFV